MTKTPLVRNMPQFKFDTFHRAQKDSLKNPCIGVTQGGSSRKNSGARVAATSSVKPRKGN